MLCTAYTQLTDPFYSGSNLALEENELCAEIQAEARTLGSSAVLVRWGE